MAKRKEYSIIAFTGRVNVGKSSLFNLLSGQEDFAIVDSHPGTTADTVTARMEIHELGPVKLLDTAGLDEYTGVGKKKRKKTYEAIEEADLVLVVIDLLKFAADDDFSAEKEIIKRTFKYGKQALIVYNIFQKNFSEEEIKKIVRQVNQKIGGNLPEICLNALHREHQKKLINFITAFFKKESREIDLIPLTGDKGYVLLNIPMDEETPALRLLRPQDMALERLLRKHFIPVLYRVDLKKSRLNDEDEKNKFLTTLKHLQQSPDGLKLVITDSQAIGILDGWVPPDIPLTTFSVMMANYMSNGNLELLVKGLDFFSLIKDGDKILIMEACNHNRICDDIGTQQIPRLLKEKSGLNLRIDFSFGSVLPEELSQYKLAIHCGGCMIDRQKFRRRLWKLKEANVPVTNYGLFFSWVNNPQTVKRVCRIFKK